MAKIKMTAVSGKGKKDIFQLFDMKQELKKRFNSLPGRLAADKWYAAARNGDYWSEDKFKQVYLEECRKHDYTAAQAREAASKFGETWKKYFQGSIDALKGTLGVIGDVSSGNFTRIPDDAKKIVKGAKDWGQALVDNTKAVGEFITAGHDYEKNKKEGDKMAIKNKVKQLTKKGFNHPEWYGKYPNFITTNLNYGVRKQGEEFEVAIGATINTVLCIPQRDKAVAQSYKDMMHALFAKLRGSNSGAFNYDVEDVAAYIETVRSIRALHAKLHRDIQAINNIDMYVSKTPFALMRVLGYTEAEANDIVDNKSVYVTTLNQIANAIDQTFPTPPDMAVFDRDEYIAVTILEDGKGPKSSVYAYRLSGFTSAKGNSNEMTDFSVSGNFASQITVLKNMITAAYNYVSASYPNRDTFAKIAGDIFKAYGQAGLNRRCLASDLSSKAEVKFDEYLLHQFQNATSATFAAGSFLRIFDTSAFNVVYYAEIGVAGSDNTKTIPESKIPVIDAGCNRYINTDKDSVTGLETLSLTRGNYTVVAKNAPFPYDDTQSYDVKDCGTDVIKSLVVVYYDSNNAIQTAGAASYSDQAPTAFKLLLQAMWAQLDYFPALYLYDENDASGKYRLSVDLATYAPMTAAQLRQFNDTCVMSLYKTVDVSDQVNFRSVKR